MPFLYSGSGTQYPLIINADGSLNIGSSVNITIDSIYVQSGTMYTFQVSGNAWSGIGSVLNTNLYAGSEVWAKEVPKTEVYNSGLVAMSGITMPQLVLAGVKTRGSGLVVFPKAHDRQIQGKTFIVGSSYYEIANGGSAGLFLDVGSCDVHSAMSFTADADARFIMMEGVTVSGTTAASGVSNPIFNQQRRSDLTMNTTVWSNPKILDSGTVIHTAMFLGGSGTTDKFVSAPVSAATDGEDIIFCAGSAYWLKIESLAGRTMNVNWKMSMHEHY